jgi:hypothetical protein
MKKLFVGNIPHSTTEAELRTLFEPHGKIDQVSVVTDRETGRSRGFAFVEMADPSEAEKAIAALNGKELPKRSAAIVGHGGEADVPVEADVLAVDVPVEAAGATTIRVMHGSPANRAGSVVHPVL